MMKKYILGQNYQYQVLQYKDIHLLNIILLKIIQKLLKKYISESYRISENFIKIIESNFIPEYIGYLPPWLTKRNLYVDYYNDKENHGKYNQDILYLIDGNNSILDISLKIKIDYFDILIFINKLLEQKIIRKK